MQNEFVWLELLAAIFLYFSAIAVGTSKRRATWAKPEWRRFLIAVAVTVVVIAGSLALALLGGMEGVSHQNEIIAKAFGATGLVIGLIAHSSLIVWFARGKPEGRIP